MESEHNPFRPPEAAIEPPAEPSADSQLLAEPRACPAGHGLSWIGQGWQLFKLRFLMWIAMLIVFGAVFMTIAVLPFIGILANLAFPLFFGGWMIACERVHREGELRFEDLFAGFQNHFGPLAITGLLYLAGMLTALMVGGLAGLLFGGSMAMMFSGDPGASIGLGFVVGFLVYMALIVPVLMLVWFAPALIVFHRLDPIPAIKLSFLGCLRNIPAYLVYGLVGMVLMILGLLPLLLGWLVVYPVLMCAVYASYLDIFLGEAPD
ncbi:MAG: hypothetical protein JJU31_12880 [Wenzhouxiangella sp.]|nr:hypothetical protein [Wenzhouxiangella sp.]MCH8477657.1 hypothetical protein [Wenzhouxiangella sp.]TVR94069.1 MAG: hypothetical protein EA418_11055 [Wenzhouxiangellaceae bacterium]